MGRALLLAVLLGLSACSSSSATGQPCGGNTPQARNCPAGYSCVPAFDGEMPDLPGVCQKND